MTSPPTFNLLDEPWIRVRDLEGQLGERSLNAVFSEASTIRRLAGEIPTQDAAILRLLLAVVLGALRPEVERSADEAVDLWEELWRSPSVPYDDIAAYLERHRHRFDLLDADAPFLQVAGLTTASGNRSGLRKLIADLPDGHAYFTTRAGRGAERLGLAEAARWLVHCHAFDPSGIKTGAVGDPRVKGGRGYPFGYPAWAGNIGLVIAEGATLAETLLLNLPLAGSGPDDLPLWDRPQLSAAPEEPSSPVGRRDTEGLRLPMGPADLFTWPSRRVLLITDGREVVDVQISNGDKRAPQNLFDEPMTAWYFSKNQSKAGTRVYMPALHDPQRYVWQGLGALLQRADEDSAHRPAGTVAWLDDLVVKGALAPDHIVDLWTVGLAYGPQNSTVAGSVDDRLTARVAALTDPRLVARAETAAASAQKGVVSLANLAGDLDRCAGGEGKARDRTFELGYALLDAPYRAWLSELSNPAKGAAHASIWAETAFAILHRAGARLVADAGRPAIVGRLVQQPGRDALVRLDAGSAHQRFLAALNTIFPQSEPHEVAS